MTLITGGASTSSRRPERVGLQGRAIAANKNRVGLTGGSIVTDWQMGLAGPIFGYNPSFYTEALITAVREGKGTVTSVAHEDEETVAEMLTDFYPDVERVRFMCNGSDPCAAAVKLARAVTDREAILSYGYHGTSSAYADSPDNRPNLGDIDMSRGTMAAERAAYRPMDWLEEEIHIGADVAAVIVECPPVDNGTLSSRGWLQMLANRARKNGSLFILDEVVTGFRYGPGGASELYQLQDKVDLYCFGKTLGNGFPIAALAGRHAIMEELTNGVHFSGTFYGHPLGLAVAKATLKELSKNPPWDHLYDIGEMLKEEWNAVVPYRLVGHPSRPIINDATIDKRFWAMRNALALQGQLFFDHPWYVSTATQENDITRLVDEAKGWLAEHPF